MADYKVDELLEMGLGIEGCEIVGISTAVSSKDFCAIQFVVAGQLTALAGNKLTGTFTGITYPAGFTLYGDITGFTTDGTAVIVGYNKS